MLSYKQTIVNNERQKLSALRIEICRDLYQIGLSGRKIEAAMREIGFPDFSYRILYPRRRGRGRRDGWIREFGWARPKGSESAGPDAGNAGEAAVPGVGDFPAWLKQISPHMSWDWKYQQVLYDALDRITRGENKRLMINIPPRHGKSELITVRYVAWRLLNQPGMNVILASYNQNLANRFSRKIRQVISDHVAIERSKGEQSASAAGQLDSNAGNPEMRPACVPGSGSSVSRKNASRNFRCAACRAKRENDLRQRAVSDTRRDKAGLEQDDRIRCSHDERGDIDHCSECGGLIDPPPQDTADASPRTASGRSVKMFPFTSSKPINTISEWGTAAGGGLKAVGVGAGVTGFGADLIVIDDPVKNRAQAESKTYRERLWDWYTDDLYTRLEPDGSVVLIQTRWHEDDLAGRLLKQMDEGGEKWEVINLPAIAEEGSAALNTDSSAGNADADAQDAGANHAGADDAGALACIADASPATSTAAPQMLNDHELLNAGGSGGRACAPVAKPRVIGYPRLYSKLSEPTALAGGEELSEPPTLAGGRNAKLENCDSIRKQARVEPLNDPDSAVTYMPPAHAGGSDRVDWRAIGEALCPPRFDVPKLAEIREQLGTYAFAALYQQHPSPAEGTIFKREWLTNIVDRAPAGLKWFRGYDLAISAKTSADYTASVRVALDEMGVMYIADGFRKRIEYPEQRRFVFERIMAEHDTQHGIEKSGNAEAIMSELRRQRILLRWPFRLIKVVADKVTRAMVWSPRAEEGKLKLVRGPWIHDFVEELAAFPVGEHDDQVDAVSVAVEMMGGGENRRLFRF